MVRGERRGGGGAEEATAGQQQQRVADVNSLYVFLWLSSRGAQKTNVQTHMCVFVPVYLATFLPQSC